MGDKYYRVQRTCSDGGYEIKGEYFPSYSDCEYYCGVKECDKEYVITEHIFSSLDEILNKRNDIGSYYFITKEEAEQKLKAVEG